jgi:hypothetical protein
LKKSLQKQLPFYFIFRRNSFVVHFENSPKKDLHFFWINKNNGIGCEKEEKHSMVNDSITQLKNQIAELDKEIEELEKAG